MKTLIVEDDFSSRVLLQAFLEGCGPVHVAVNGNEAVAAFQLSMDADEPYDLVCLDIMMPELDGYGALKKMRGLEQDRGIRVKERAKIIMTTALDEMNQVRRAFNEECDAYLVKPISRAQLMKQVSSFELVK